MKANRGKPDAGPGSILGCCKILQKFFYQNQRGFTVDYFDQSCTETEISWYQHG